MENVNNYKSGYIAVIGRPNVGKSTIINSILGEKINIVTPRPQTTRNNILGIFTTKEFQIIFIDTPGIHRPKTLLGKQMVKKAKASLIESDIVLFVIEAAGLTQEDILIANLLKKYKNPVFLLINKIDVVPKQEILPVIEAGRHLHPFQEIMPISGLDTKDIALLKKKLTGYLPFGPQYYPQDQISNRQERFFVAEIIRERVLKNIREEVPHSVAIKLDEMKDRNPGLSYIKAVIYVERNSQKMIIIGKAGDQLKEIGKQSRKRLEEFLKRRVYLELWVKVYKNWRKDPSALKMLGYSAKT